MSNETNPNGKLSTIEETGSKSCPKCRADDNEEMVACDECNNWYHFKCVGEDQSVADRDWTCEICTARRQQPNTQTKDDAAVTAIEHQVEPLASSSEERHLLQGASGTSMDQENRKTVTDSIKTVSSKASSSSSMRRKRMIELERIEAEAALNANFADELEKRLAEDTARQIRNQQEAFKVIEMIQQRENEQRARIAKERADKEAELLARKFAIRQEELDDNSSHSSTSCIDLESHHSDVNKWVTSTISKERSGTSSTGAISKHTSLRVHGTTSDSHQTSVVPHPTSVLPNHLSNAESRPISVLPNHLSNVESRPISVLPNHLSNAESRPTTVFPNHFSTAEPKPTTVLPNHPTTAETKSSNVFPNYRQTSDAQPTPATRQAPIPSTAAAPSNQYPFQQFIPMSWPQPDFTSAPSYPTATTHQPFSDQSGAYGYNHSGLHPRQLATRQVLSKDLPIFNGKPEEWAIFIANYEQSTAACGYSNHENLLRLQKALKGRALKAVETRLIFPNNVPLVIETLRMFFGDPEIIIEHILQSLRSYPTIRTDKMDSLMDFALHVECLCATIESTGLLDELRNCTLLKELVNKLPFQIKLNWGMYIESSQPFPPKSFTISRPTLPMFSKWLGHVARAARRVNLSSTFSIQQNEPKRDSKPKFVHTHSVESTQQPDTHSSNEKSKITCFTCNNSSHKTDVCTKFKNLPLDEKWSTVHANNLCRKCLGQHNAFRCTVRKLCGVNDCTFKHHQLLHNVNRSTNATVIPTASTPSECNAHITPNRQILFRIVPVILFGKNKQVNTFAFLDEGSSVTLLEQQLADELEISGTSEELCMKWTAEQIRIEDKSQRISLQLSGRQHDAKRYSIKDVRTVQELNLPKQTIHKATTDDYQHLQNLPIQHYTNATPRMLIGIDNWKLGIPQIVKQGSWSQPVATKTRLGWVLHGHNQSNNNNKSNESDYSLHICGCKLSDESLHQQVKNYFAIENFGVKIPETLVESKEDVRAKDIMRTTTVRDEIGFTTGLLWRYDEVNLPDSYAMAKRRMICLNKKMSRDSVLATNLKEQIREYQDKGYIRLLSSNELNVHHNRTWYLPIFVVTNKPGKVRIVWDAAAKVDGISLNSVLLKGPDQLVSLPGVLQRFRQKKIAVCGDIQQMFHQIRIRQDDQHSQRFLWQDEDKVNGEPNVFAMQVMTFGATCSPSSAQYVKNLNAEEYRAQYPKAYTSIVNNHYVDDMLESADSEEEAVQLIKDVIYVHRRGGFHIRSWLSNSKTVLEAIDEDIRSGAKDLQMSTEMLPSKILGMWWCTESDEFTYSLSLAKANMDVLQGKQRPTKREVLRTLMTVYDPLGFLASFLLPIKILLQDIWRSGIDWDDKLEDDQNEKWSNWITKLPFVETIRIPRCYSKNITSATTIELHIFVDASENAFAAVAYFRMIHENGDIECSIIGAKTRVAPMQPLSIPRMELQAATLGTRFANNIAQSHTITISRTVFWSDSRNVLSWIKSDARKYKQFVAFRIGEILESTEVNQWRWVPTKENVADEATKYQPNYDFSRTSRWQNGPAFLYQPESHWPTCDLQQPEITIEMRPCHLHIPLTKTNGFDTSRFSSWKRLVHAQAYVHRFIYNLMAKWKKSATRNEPYFTFDEYTQAEMTLFRQSQIEGFQDEVAILHSNQGKSEEVHQIIPKSSEIYTASPYLDEHKVLRMRGRIDAIPIVPFDTRRPILLPRRNQITYLIVSDYHKRYHHQNQETVVNEIRQKFYISSIRETLKYVRKQCQLCKNASATPKAPEMSNLPSGRLAAFTRPFAHTGVDYFGPINITVGRRTEKRYRVLFTCLTIRAVHIEVAHSLSTDSFLMCLKNFISRRGQPNEIYSDNGTNFVGAEKELKIESKRMDRKNIMEFSESKFKWHFNPPASPHMGGAWERLVRSVKTALYATMPTRNPNEETLQSLLVEIENIVNSRPLTHIPIDNRDEEALTPNHFLLGSTNGSKPLGQFNDDALISSKNWKKIERLGEHFWRKWVREYLPTLARRTKWFMRTKPIAIGDVVIIVDPNQPKHCWPKGIILEIKPGKDGQVRQATIQTAKGIYTRPATKIAVLDVDAHVCDKGND